MIERLNWTPLRTAWHSAWQQRSPREQWMLRLAGWLMALTAIWSLALAPALRTWQEAPTRQTQLDAQSQHMRQLQDQALSLKKSRTMTRTEAALWLEQSLTKLGPNPQISLQGERATLRVQAAPAGALAVWLSQARENAQALPVQAELQQTTALATTPNAPRSSTGQMPATAAPASAQEVLWKGSLVLQLP